MAACGLCVGEAVNKTLPFMGAKMRAKLIPMQKVNKARLRVGLDELYRDAVTDIQPVLVAGDAALDGRLQKAGVDFPVLNTGDDGIEYLSQTRL